MLPRLNRHSPFGVREGNDYRKSAFLDGFPAHLDNAFVGSISEVFDGDPPYHPRACIAHAWSVAEVLRTWLKTTPAKSPAGTDEADVVQVHSPNT